MDPEKAEGETLSLPIDRQRNGIDVSLTEHPVSDMIREDFDDRGWHATEAILAAHATLLLDASAATGLVIVGSSGGTKSTVLSFFEHTKLSDQIYRSDDVTPASFVSGDATKDPEELEDVDLLPRIAKKTLLVRDLGPWFAGEEEKTAKRWSRMAPMLDGKGFTRDTGTQGQRGYTGAQYRFNLLGATTPLSPRAWRVMGRLGHRILFYEIPNQDLGEYVDAVAGSGWNYDEAVERCQTLVWDFLNDLWGETGGFASVEWPDRSADPSVQKLLRYFADLVRHARASIKDRGPERSAGGRIVATLWNLARGRALLDGRTHVEPGDFEVVARVALSTMPAKRRPVVRGLLNPRNSELMTADVERLAGVSRPTATDRLEDLATLGLANCTNVADDDRDPMVAELRSKFQWPDTLAFPER